MRKKQFIAETDEELRKVRYCSVLETIHRYLTREQEKRPRHWYIGITTVFILVMVITMLKSVIDSFPIVFVKLYQD